MALLSLCMITKNEEKVLARCLDSVKDIAEEIIIVDTGSTDQTLEIASRYTQHIHHFEWINDFAAARNEAVRRATGRWILVLDADEYLSDTDLPAMKQFLMQATPDETLVYNLQIVNYIGDSLASSHMMVSSANRLFPNHMGIHYERPIHEQLRSTRQGVELHMENVPYRIYHTGYLQTVKDEKQKSDRNMSIFKKMQEEADLEPYDHYTLGNEYQALQRYPEALKHFQQSFERTPRTATWYSYNLIALIGTLFKLDRLTESWKLIEGPFREFEDYPDYHSIKGLHYETLGFFAEASACYRTALEKAEKRAKKDATFWLFSPDYGSEIPIDRLAELSLRMNKRTDYVFWMTKLLIHKPHDLSVLIRLLEWLVQTDSPEDIIRLLNGIYNTDKPADTVVLFKASLAVGNRTLAEHYLPAMKAIKPLQAGDCLRLALIQNSEIDWDHAYLQRDASDSSIRQNLLAALIWNKPELVKHLHLAADHEYVFVVRTVMSFLNKNDIPASELEENAHRLFLIAKELFLLQQFEAFDHWVSQISSVNLVNMLANYFYSRNQLGIAFNYYSLLDKENKLNIDSLENLGMYYASEGEKGEAYQFLSEACRKEPGRRYLYSALMTLATDDTARQNAVQRFKKQFPHIADMPLISS